MPSVKLCSPPATAIRRMWRWRAPVALAVPVLRPSARARKSESCLPITRLPLPPEYRRPAPFSFTVTRAHPTRATVPRWPPPTGFVSGRLWRPGLASAARARDRWRRRVSAGHAPRGPRDRFCDCTQRRSRLLHRQNRTLRLLSHRADMRLDAFCACSGVGDPRAGLRQRR